MKKTLIYALAAVVALSAAPAFADSYADADANAPLAAQLQAAQHGVGPAFGDDTRATPPVQYEQAPRQSGMTASNAMIGAPAYSDDGMTIAPYPNSERPAFDGGR